MTWTAVTKNQAVSLKISGKCRIFVQAPDFGVKAPVESKPLQTQSCLEVKAGHDGQLLHGQLLGRLLVTMAAAAFDFSAAAKVLRSGEPGRGEESV